MHPIAIVSLLAASQRQFQATGVVLAIDRNTHTVTISHNAIEGFMDAMVMPFATHGTIPETLHPGDSIRFTLRIANKTSWVENIVPVPFASDERDPAAARRLKLLDPPKDPLPVGASVPDFHLTDQSGHSVKLSDFPNKIIAIDFVYTRCPLPDYCFRLSTNFARLQKRFRDNPNLVLLTISFDPAHDTPEALTRYAQIWKADLKQWHFLTGSPEEIHRIAEQLGVGYWLDEGVFTHTLHTAVIDRTGKLAANMEGNRFTAKQLGDLIEELGRR